MTGIDGDRRSLGLARAPRTSSDVARDASCCASQPSPRLRQIRPSSSLAKPFEASQNACVSKTDEVEMEVQCMCSMFDSGRRSTPEFDQTPDRLICGLVAGAELAAAGSAEAETDGGPGAAGSAPAARVQ